MDSLVNINDRYKKRPDSTGLKYGIIEATTACQCACPGCYMVRRNFLNKGEMTLKKANCILDLCRDYSGRELETMDILGGEPLLWPYLKDYIKELLRRGIIPWIFTNMISITPELAAWLYEREIHVTGKLNINPDNNSEIELQAEMIGRPVNVAKQMLSAVNIFLQAGYKDPLFRLQNLIRRNNVKFVPGYYKWCLQKNIGADLELMGSGETVGLKYWQVAPTAIELAKMIKEIQIVRKNFGLISAEVLMPHVFGACPFFDKGLYFDVDGGIRACSNSLIQLSHLNDSDPISRAYESDLICDRLNLSHDLVGEPCRSCDKWGRCRGGCRATVEGMGNPFGGYTLCPYPWLAKV